MPSTAWSVGRSVTTVSPAKTAEPIDMRVGLWTRVGPRNYHLPSGNGTFEGMTSGFPCMLPTSVPIGLPRTQSSVTLNFPNEKCRCDAACRHNCLTACFIVLWILWTDVHIFVLHKRQHIRITVAASVVETRVIDRLLSNCIFHIVDMRVLRRIICRGLVACRKDSRDSSVTTMTNCDYTRRCTESVRNNFYVYARVLLCIMQTVCCGLLTHCSSCWDIYWNRMARSVLGSVISVRCCNRLNIHFVYSFTVVRISVVYTFVIMSSNMHRSSYVVLCNKGATTGGGIRTPQNLDGPPQVFWWRVWLLLRNRLQSTKLGIPSEFCSVQ